MLVFGLVTSAFFMREILLFVRHFFGKRFGTELRCRFGCSEVINEPTGKQANFSQTLYVDRFRIILWLVIFFVQAGMEHKTWNVGIDEWPVVAVGDHSPDVI